MIATDVGENRSMPLAIINDKLVRLRPLDLGDVDEWMAGEDAETVLVIFWPEQPSHARFTDVCSR